MHLLESGEMYIETIHVLSKKGGVVRSVDVSEHMGVSKPSVSRAIGLLKEGGYVTMARDGALTLTEAGVEVAAVCCAVTPDALHITHPIPVRL